MECAKQRAKEDEANEPLTQDEADAIAAEITPPIPSSVDGKIITKIAIGIANEWRVDIRTQEHYPLKDGWLCSGAMRNQSAVCLFSFD